MIQQSPLRAIFGFFIGIVTGISLTMGVLPTVLSVVFEINSFETMIVIRGLILPVIIFWAIGGAWLGWQGGAQTGGLILGLCGAISGLLLSLLAFNGALPLVSVNTLTGLIYGGVGGLILGRVFPKPTKEAA